MKNDNFPKIFIMIILLSRATFCIKNNDVLKNGFDLLETKNDQAYVSNFRNTAEASVIEKYYSSFMSESYATLVNNVDFNKFFETRGVKYDADKGYIFLIAWHRKLNNKPLQIENMTEEVRRNYSELNRCIKSKQIIALSNFQALSIMDTVTLKIPLEISEDNVKSTFFYDCPNKSSWENLKNENLMIRGIVLDKFERKPSGSFHVVLRVISLSDSESLFFFKKINISDTIQVNLNDYGLPL